MGNEAAMINERTYFFLGECWHRDADTHEALADSCKMSEVKFKRYFLHWAFLVLRGKTDESTARVQIQLYLKNKGYIPTIFDLHEAGDLSSTLRLSYQLSAFRGMMQGVRCRESSFSPASVRLYPAWELVVSDSEKMHWLKLWLKFGGRLGPDQRLIALKTDPIWKMLGSSDISPGALDIDHPPFVWKRFAMWMPVGYAKLKEWGFINPAEFQFATPRSGNVKLSEIRKIWRTVWTMRNFSTAALYGP